jgi:uncharacterized membrane protein
MKLSEYTLGCHGIPERCFSINKKHMPFCARCLGASIGHISSAICFFWYYLPSFYIAVLGLGVMFADWYLQNTLKKYHSNLMRLATGIIGGFSMGIILWSSIGFILKSLSFI